MLFDVLVIGSGIAGLRAALEASKYDLKVAIMTKGNPLRSNSSMASGGINASLATMEEDSPDLHVADTIKGGCGLCKQKAVEYMCYEAPSAINELYDLGVEFDLFNEEKISQRSFGGAGKKRTCYIADKSGAAIVQALLLRCKKSQIIWVNNHQLLNILTTNKRASGITALNKENSSVVTLVSKSIIIATGGYASIYKGHTTNPIDTSGDGVAALFRAGVNIANMEFVQFHPTGLYKSGALLSEAARGEGGYLLNEDGERFVDELETRDKIARAIYNQMIGESGKLKKVYLDVRHLGEDVINKKLPSLRKAAISSEGVDPLYELVPIKPVAHYSMGGVECEVDTRCSIEGVFVCGEAAYNGAHGANRLGGNSLLEGVVFGKRAGVEAAKFAKRSDYLEIDYQIVGKDKNLIEHILEGESRYNIGSIKTNLGNMMFKNVGIYRDEESLMSAFDYIKYLRRLIMGLCCVNKNLDYNFELSAILELRNQLLLSEAIILGALERRESRGAHYRIDYPNSDPKFAHNSYIKEMKNGYMDIEFSHKEGVVGIINRFKKFMRN